MVVLVERVSEAQNLLFTQMNQIIVRVRNKIKNHEKEMRRQIQPAE